MVHLSISALKGNQGGRTYPYAGYLGLSKITVDGVVRTRVEDDNRLLPASSITISIRCYEARTRFTISKVNLLLDATQTLWSAADGLEYEDVGNSDHPFRISLPSKVAGFSTMQYPDYRIFWRLEAAVNHSPLLGLGTRHLRVYDLTLTRYDFPEPLPEPSSPYRSHVPIPKHLHAPLHTFQPSGPLAHLPPCQYRITLPSSPIGPSSFLPVALTLCLPVPAHSPPLALHSVSIVLERRMDFYEASGTQSSPELLSGTATTTPELSPAPSRASFRSTVSTITPHSPSSSFSSATLTGFSIGRKRSAGASPAAVLPAKSHSTIVATAESTLRGSAGRSSSSAEFTINLAVPPRPAPSQWPLGETTRTDLASIAFYVRVKVGVVAPAQSQAQSRSQSPHHAASSSSGAAPTVYEYELPEREVQVVSVTEEERALALARVAERRSRSGANSRRPSVGAADAKPMLTADAGAGGEVVPPLPKGANTIKFEFEDPLKSGVSAALLNSRLKNVKASREAAAPGLIVCPPSTAAGSTSSCCSGSSACSSGPSTAPYSPLGGQNDHNSTLYNHHSNESPIPRTTRSKTPVGTLRRPQTTSGAPPSAHNNKAAQAPVRRTQSGQATYHRPPNDVGELLAPDWAERDGGKASVNSSRRSSKSAGGKSDSEARVRERKDRSPTAAAIALDPTPPPVPSKDGVGVPTSSPPRTIPPSPSRPIPPPPPSSFPNSLSPSPSPSPASLSPSSSPPASVSGHDPAYAQAQAQAQILRASVNPSARSSPNLLDPLSADARGRDKQRRPRGNSSVSSRTAKIFSALLSAKA